MDPLSRLAIAARDGDAQALEQLIRSSQSDVYRFCARLTSTQEAADLTQETYLRAWRSLGRFRGDSSARTWLLGVARNVVADHLRRSARRHRLQAVDHVDTALLADGVRHEDRSSELATAALLDGLSTDRREAFVLTQILGLSYDEAAEVVGVPVGTIRSHVARARDELVTSYRRAEETGT